MYKHEMIDAQVTQLKQVLESPVRHLSRVMEPIVLVVLIHLR